MNTIEQLRAKAENDSVRMPSIKAIHKLLFERGIEHTFRDTVNVVEYRSKGNRYVNSRHNGKEGKILTIKLTDAQSKLVDRHIIELNTADSYYSLNTWNYARQLVQILDNQH